MSHSRIRIWQHHHIKHYRITSVQSHLLIYCQTWTNLPPAMDKAVKLSLVKLEIQTEKVPLTVKHMKAMTLSLFHH